MKTFHPRWWVADPAVAMCPIKECGCPIQRTYHGTVQDGMRLHFSFVHPGRQVPSVALVSAAGGESR